MAPEVTARGQYRSDQQTPIPVGGYTGTDGVSNSIWAESDIYSGTPGSTTVLNAEVRPIGTSFTNTASTSGLPNLLKESSLPTSRRGGNLVYDTKNKRFILFGGYNGTIRFNEVWELSADTAYARWHKLTPTGTAPSARNLAGSSYVRGTNTNSQDKAYMIIWGGAVPGDANDMYTLDLSTRGNESWATVTQTNTPAVRSYLLQHMVPKSTGAATSDLYLFGGWGATRTNDLQRCTFNVNTPTSVTWTTLKTNGAAGSPSGRSGTGMVYDPINDRLVLMGGYTGSTYLNDVWQYSLASNTFTQVTPTGTAPAIRELHSVAYDPTNQRMVIMGGWQGSTSTNRNDIIQLSLSSGSEAWLQLKSNDLNNQGVVAFSAGATAVDSSRNIMVVATLNAYDTSSKYIYAFNLADTTSKTLYGMTTVDYLRGRDAPGYVFNSTRNEWLLINGYSAMDDDTTISNGEHVSEVWAYDQAANTWRYAAKGPFNMPQSEGGIAIYDSLNDRILYFGGLTGLNQRLNDVWQLKADAYGMYHATKLSPSGTLPTQRWLMAGCYDATRQRMVIWGGQSASNVLGDMWALDLTQGAEAWTQLTPTGTAPSAAWQPCFAFDTSSKRLYVHAGATDQSGTTFTSQLFYLDVSTAQCNWVNTGVTGGPAVRGAALGFDSTNQRLICFGGYDGTTVNNTLRYTSTSGFTSWTTQSAPNTPAARRSSGYMTIGNEFFVTCGRPVSGMWFSDTQSLNVTATPASWAWTAKNPKIYEVMAVPINGLTSRASYHWQSWGVTGSSVGSVSSFGGNIESAADFTVGSVGGKVKINTGSWNAKPVKIWNGSSWVQKPARVWNGSVWLETNY